MSIQIACGCGDVALDIEGAPLAQFFCHCDDCQAVHGAAVVPVALYRIDQTRLTRGAPVQWARAATPRASCVRCGTRLYAEPPIPGLRSVMAALLPEFAPQFHMQCRFARVRVADDLPHYAGLPPQFGGADERVAW